jgi:histidyl-tRNA synthetase
MSKTQPARGMRDFLPSDVRKREYVIGIIKEVYQKYGFEPLETPSVENLETLTGKYGEEGNQLIFKILKRGEKLDLEHGEKGLSDLALRYDLTVPLARVVANYKNELPKFFKRYQIQPVWRADRPARGRYREFYQCDVDAIGSKSMIVEAELISAVCEILERLGFADFIVKVNHRKILTGMLEASGIDEDKYTDALTALDKIDKIGSDGVQKELEQRGISKESSKKLLDFGSMAAAAMMLLSTSEKSNNEKKTLLEKENFINFNKNQIEYLEDEIGPVKGEHQGLDEMYKILRFTTDLPIWFDVNLARGLSYYTGAIFEIVLTNGDFAGSIGGGGRYDGLIGMFGKEQIPACGFSLGLERILVVMEERGMFPESLQTNSADVMVTIWNEESIAESLKLANELRATGLRVLVYPEADKLGKQFKYAGSINVPFVCILGENELAENKVAVKNMTTGEQEIVEREAVANKLKR